MFKLLWNTTAMTSLLKAAGPTAEAVVDMMTTGLIAPRVERSPSRHDDHRPHSTKGRNSRKRRRSESSSSSDEANPIPQVLKRKKLIAILGFNT